MVDTRYFLEWFHIDNRKIDISLCTVEEGNFEHLFKFETNLKICPIFFLPLFFSLKAKPKILLGVATPFSMVLPPLVGLFLK